MAAHRYWRARGFQPYGDGAVFALTEFWLLFGGSRVDAPAALTSSLSPLSGSLSALRDGAATDACVLPANTILQWDFGGSPVDVDDIRLGSGGGIASFPGYCVIEWSDNGTTWTRYEWLDREQGPHWFAWPGPYALTASFDNRGWTLVGSTRMVLDPLDPAIAAVDGSAGHTIFGAAVASRGVRQFEITRTTVLSFMSMGVIRRDFTGGDSANGWQVYVGSGEKASLGSPRTSFPTGGWAPSDVFGCVVNFSTGSFTAYKNGVSLGVAFTNLANEVVRPWTAAPTGSGGATLRTNNFQYPIAGAEPWTQPFILPTTRPEFRAPGLLPPVSPQPAGYVIDPLRPAQRARTDFLFDRAARGRIAANVRGKGSPNFPLSRRVRLYRERDGLLIRETWSDAQGFYSFDYLEEWEVYTVISHDYQKTFRAAVADGLVPTLIEG